MHSTSRLLLALLGALMILSACAGDETTEATAAEETAATDTAEETTEENAEESDTADATDEAEVTEASESTTTGSDEQVEINLIDELDGIINGYCLDIAGGNESVDPANGLQVHTCYSYRGDLGTDQIFATAEFDDGALYMPIYDVCAEVAAVSAGAAVGLSTCDGGDLQSISFEDDGTLRPTADMTLCFTANSESTTGRSGDHQIRALSLETCADELTSLQQWSFRTGL